MNIELQNVTEEQFNELVQDIFDSYPEAGSGMSLVCKQWNYKRTMTASGEFGKLADDSVGHNQFPMVFHDVEEDKEHIVTKEMALVGLRKFIEIALVGKGFH